MMGRIREYLLSDLSREYACQLLCGSALIEGRIRLLAAYLVLPHADDYVRQSVASLELTREYDLSIRHECASQQLHLIDFHSHPFAQAHVSFSGIDDADEFGKSKWFSQHLPGIHFGSVVVAQDAVLGRLFPAGAEGAPASMPLVLRSLDIPLGDTIQPDKGKLEDVRFDRQVRAFGRDGQARLAQARIAVVGVGGLGSMVAHGLCRLGVERLVLIDPDRAEISNLNRLVGLTSAGARRRPRKVSVIANRLRAIRPEIEVEAIACDVFEPDAWRRLRDVDVIVVATDNYATRMLLNQVSVQFLVPLVSCGVQIRTNGSAFEDAYAEVFVFLPGQPGPCLVCAEIVNVLEAYYEVGPEENRREAARRGYVEGFDEPAPAVFHLNGIAANVALAEIHNLLCGFMAPRAHLHYRMSQRELKPLLHRADKRCAICAPNGGRFARGDALDPVPNLFPQHPSAS